MNSDPNQASQTNESVVPTTDSTHPAEAASVPQAVTDSRPRSDLERASWWIGISLQCVILVCCAVLFVIGLGVAQRVGWIATTGESSDTVAAESENVRYICPMMCVPAQGAPGRCPVCAMELVPATGAPTEVTNYVEISAAARRIANIQTTPVVAGPMSRRVEAIGEIRFNEGNEKTITAYVDGRIDELYADYTGVEVESGDQLAMFYAPQLYSSQIVFLQARQAWVDGQQNASSEERSIDNRMFQTSRQRLIELGMTETQIGKLEETGQAQSRMHLTSPMTGTVVEKYVVEGQQLSAGDPIYKLVDLTSVWLTLELFPEDAAAIRYGQRVEAVVQSEPGRTFVGRVAFVEPTVNQDTRTVGVRVVIPNVDRRLRVGDYANATIQISIVPGNPADQLVFDEELADKWISPRHPHVISSEPGICPICQIELVHASEFGFTSEPNQDANVLIVPRTAVLMAGANSVAYVETQIGRFELRRVMVGPILDDQIVILDGVSLGEQVAKSGNFLIDSQMQLAGNPSLIDPTRYEMNQQEDQVILDREMLAEIDKLSPTDAMLAKHQKICPVARQPLGSMGVPPIVEVEGRRVFICCEGCRGALESDPQTYLANIPPPPGQGAPDDHLSHVTLDADMLAEIAKLAPEDASLARHQKICPVAKQPLGSMGVPPIVEVQGRRVFICCEGCRGRLESDPQTYLANIPPPPGQDAPADHLSDVTLDSDMLSEIAKLAPEDAALARHQKICPVAEQPLGSMGVPAMVEVEGRRVFICCEGCRARLESSPAKYLSRIPEEPLK